MIPAPFEYVRPPDLDGVLRALSDHEGDAKILSGGYSLLPLLKLRLAQPALLVDIQSVTGLDGIVETRRRAAASAPARRIARSTRTRSSSTATRSSTTSPAGSAIRRSATGARSAAPSRTRIPPRTGRPPSSP